jgi:arsenite methyltransferase
MSSDNNRDKKEQIRQAVRDGYGKIARTGSGCCGSGSPKEFAQQIGYTPDELAALPEGANLGLSCGNPTALAELKAGQVVLDLGSGAGLDIFIAAKKVGPTGRAIGVDMTPEMLDKARHNIEAFRQKTGLANAEFRLGEIEHLPVADASIDVVISNCVINLSADKPQVWRQIGRVLRPGGRVSVSDLALKKPLPESIREMVVALVGCVAGAVTIDETVKMAREAGLGNIQWTEKKYTVDVMEGCNDRLYQSVKQALPKGETLSDYVVSVNITAEKPSTEILSTKYKELVAIGASVTGHCQSCLTWHLDKARQSGASEKEIDMAISIGKAVQKGSVAAMELFINEQRGQRIQAHESICQPKDPQEIPGSKSDSSCGCK